MIIPNNSPISHDFMVIPWKNTDVCSNVHQSQELPGDEDFEVIAGLSRGSRGSRGSSLRDGSFAPSSQQLGGDGWEGLGFRVKICGQQVSFI